MSRSLIPGKVCLVDEIPECFFCAHLGEPGVPGPYDFATRMGPWGNGCEKHYRELRAAPGLGVGKAQLWVTEDQVDEKSRTIRFPDGGVDWGTISVDSDGRREQ